MTITRERIKAFRKEYGMMVPKKVKDESPLGILAALRANTQHAPANSFEVLIQESVTQAVIHQSSNVSVVRRFGNVQQISATTNNYPYLKSRTPTVGHYPRLSSSTIADSDFEMGSAMMEASKRTCNAKMSTELFEDGLDVVSAIATQFGAALGKETDRIAFSGDESQSDGYVQGITNALRASSLHTAATGNTSVTTLDVDDFVDTMEKLPEFADSDKPRWFMSRSAYAKSVLRLAGASALTQPVPDDADGVLLNHKVHFVPGMADKDAAAGSVVAVFGHLALGTILGDQGPLKWQSVELFDTDQVVMKLRKFDDFVCWDRGTDEATDPAGSLVGLKLAES
ncbi:phage major capsid protein [Stieleria mannarensis]|uniref:phage major capsid protein n=1 Tax=Stieleria mannarensis TaxID=2755585 RepID=UPI001603E01E|nr:phage major capsid protein [Rhodopirellula sp. JC639]